MMQIRADRVADIIQAPTLKDGAIDTREKGDWVNLE